MGGGGQQQKKNLAPPPGALTSVSCPWGRTWGLWGCPGGQRKFEYGHVTYQIDGDDKQNRMQVNFLPKGKTG